jgi:hypothetical protein
LRYLFGALCIGWGGRRAFKRHLFEAERGFEARGGDGRGRREGGVVGGMLMLERPERERCGKVLAQPRGLLKAFLSKRRLGVFVDHQETDILASQANWV